MKKRIFALLLCVVMLASMIPLMGASVSENGGTGTVAVSPTAAPVSEDSKAVITAAGGDGAYQWQIYAGNDVWANIAGQTGAQLTVSYGMVCGLMEGGKAYVRCRVTNGENEACSSPVEIVIAGEAEEQSGGIAALFARLAPSPVAADEPVGTAAADEPVGTVVREAYVLGEPVIILPGAATPAPTATPAAEATPAPTATPAAEATPAPAEDTDEAPAEEPTPAPDAEAPAEDGAEAESSPAPTEEAAASPAPVTEAAEENTAAPAQDAEAAEENTAAPAQDAEAAPTAARSISAPALRLAPLRRFSSVDTNDPAETGDASDATPTPAPDTYHIRINYVFEDGEQAANPWTAKLAAGSSYSATVVSPAIVGYAPDQASVTVDVSNIDDDVAYKVTYKPSKVNYTVHHYVQNTMDDGYTLVDTATGKAFTHALVSSLGDLSNKYEGCYSLLYDDTVRIAADGSTVIDIKYDRYYYLLNFDLKGGYGVEPIYARYGAPVSVGTPAKAGYIFDGWDKELPKTVPAYNDKFTAKWREDKAGFTVVFWYENADPETDGTYKYSVAGTYKPEDVPSGTEVSSDNYKNQSFTGRDDDHFTYNTDKVETVTVAGDGSTVLNVYFTRNSYTLTFPGAALSCSKVEHEHNCSQCCTKTGWHLSCNTKKCPVGYEHTHVDSCYANYTVTAKYDSDITYVWKNDPIKALLNQGYVFKSSITDKYYSFLEKMPGQDITMTKTEWSGDTYTWYYYLEVLPGQNTTGLTTRKDGGKTYYLYNTTTVKGPGISLTYDEDYFPITGFAQRDNDVPSFDNNRTAYLYYTRNSYSLTFMNYGTVAKTGTKLYQADISGEYFVPEYPSTLEPGAYTFDGWYIDETMQQRFSFENATMPAKPIVLHANWVPVTHTVTTWLTVDKDTPVIVGTTGSNEQTVPHGGTAEAPADPVRDPYKFIGWFYKDENGTEKAFDFSMPVHRDLDLYAKWNGDQLVDYVIRYTDEVGNEIAPPTTGKALAGTTKTFDAKAGDELNEGYRTGYYPTTNSHSMVMEIKEENGKNEFTFVYKQMPEVQYTVRYINRATGNNVFDVVGIVPEKIGMTSAAVWTETFRTIKGYRPDAYQKRLVLSVDPAKNVITFYYDKDEVHAPVQVIHWTQNIAGDGYTEYQSSTDLNGEIDKPYSAEPITIPGFDFKCGKVGDKETELVDGKLTATVTADGLVLNLYYDRILYPYEFKFLEQGTDKELAESVADSARYQARVTQTAKDIPGYTLVSADSQSIIIDIEDGTTAVKNVKTFYYTEQTVDIRYEVVGPAGSGTLDNYQESQLKVMTGEVKGSAPTAADGFKFVGWYKDKECTQPVDADWVKDSKLTPDKSKNYGTAEEPVMGYEAATYYAKFEYDVADLTITKRGCEGIDENQSFIFDVTGPNGYSKRVAIKGNDSVTISGLKIGAYTVTEVTGWSWRYKPNGNGQTIALQPTEKNEVTFVNGRTGLKWLGGDAYNQNIFGG